MSYGGYSGGRSYGGNSGGRSYGGRHSGGRGGKAGKNAFGIRRDQIGGKLNNIDWDKQNLQPFTKETWKRPAENRLTPKEVYDWREKQQVLVEGDQIPDPILSFLNAGLPGGFLAKFGQLGFNNPTPIQAQAWPMLLSGRDVVGIAQTGSGKTLAFVLPGILHIQAQPLTQNTWGRNGPVALVVAPTRELAIQIEQETKKFAYSFGVTVTCVYGGAPKRAQMQSMRSGMQFLIATPGRLIDFLERGNLTLTTCSYAVFDEADRMLDMGFEPQIRAIMSQVRPDRQMLMFSATWPREVQSLAREFFNGARLKIKVGNSEKAASTVTQKVEVLGRHLKRQRLQEVLNQFRGQKVLIFTSTKRMADELAYTLTQYGADAIHGDKEQWRREQAINSFKRGEVTVLVATDVASRGLDVKDLALVINYDFPQNCEDYIHRVGRTGRAGATGMAITFFDPRNDAKHAYKLTALLEKNNQEVPHELRTLSQSRGGRGGGRSRYGGGRSRGGGHRSRGGYRSRGGSSFGGRAPHRGHRPY